MPIILVANEKGGVGKTTVATNIASVEAKKLQSKKEADRKGVLLFDTDKQGSANMWSSLRQEITPSLPEIITISKFGNVKKELLAMKNKFDVIIVDAGGHDSVELRSAMLVADIMICPIKPSQFDLWTTAKINRHVADAKMLNENLRAHFLINEASTHHKSREINNSEDFLDEFDELTLLNSVLHQRKSFRDAAQNGMGVIDLPYQDEKATSEITSLYKEIYQPEEVCHA